jgi:hypothetical protein
MPLSACKSCKVLELLDLARHYGVNLPDKGQNMNNIIRNLISDNLNIQDRDCPHGFRHGDGMYDCFF